MQLWGCFRKEGSLFCSRECETYLIMNNILHLPVNLTCKILVQLTHLCLPSVMVFLQAMKKEQLIDINDLLHEKMELMNNYEQFTRNLLKRSFLNYNFRLTFSLTTKISLTPLSKPYLISQIFSLSSANSSLPICNHPSAANSAASISGRA